MLFKLPLSRSNLTALKGVRIFMKVVLLQNIKNVGSKNEIVNVKDGYALNYLFPQKLAVSATVEKVADLRTAAQKIQAEEQKILSEIETVIKKLNQQKVKISKQASAKGKLFAALDPQEVFTAIKKNFKIDLQKFETQIDKTIKEIGFHEVNLKIGKHNIKFTVEVDLESNTK